MKVTLDGQGLLRVYCKYLWALCWFKLMFRRGIVSKGHCWKDDFAQSIVIAATAVGLRGKEGLIMRRTIKYAIPYVLFLGFMVWLYSFVFPGLVP